MRHISKEIDLSVPKHDEFELSLFGPGVGECIVSHLGNGKWLVVDSCLHPKDKQPIALNYLEQLGVDPKQSIETILISHWHSDHIRGAAKLVNNCSGARVCYPASLLEKEFLSFVSAYSGSNITPLIDHKTSATKEFSDIVKILMKNCDANSEYKSEYLSPVFSDKLIFEDDNEDFTVRVRALSPSDKAYHNSIQQFSSLIPQTKEMKKVIPIPKQNDNSIVLWIQFNDLNILLGSDLQETNDDHTGWSAIVNSRQRPNGKATIFKIPHHGSKNGHSDKVWENIVSELPISLLTSMYGGRSPIPKKEDIGRLKKYCNDLFCTTLPKGVRVKREPTVEKMLKGIVKKRYILSGDVGHIQIRFSSTSKIDVNYSDVAVAL